MARLQSVKTEPPTLAKAMSEVSRLQQILEDLRSTQSIASAIRESVCGAAESKGMADQSLNNVVSLNQEIHRITCEIKGMLAEIDQILVG